MEAIVVHGPSRFRIIDQMAKKMDQLPGQHVMAFKTGGFDWPASGEINCFD